MLGTNTQANANRILDHNSFAAYLIALFREINFLFPTPPVKIHLDVRDGSWASPHAPKTGGPWVAKKREV